MDTASVPHINWDTAPSLTQLQPKPKGGEQSLTHSAGQQQFSKQNQPKHNLCSIFYPKRAAARGSFWLELKLHKHQQHNSKFKTYSPKHYRGKVFHHDNWKTFYNQYSNQLIGKMMSLLFTSIHAIIVKQNSKSLYVICSISTGWQ